MALDLPEGYYAVPDPDDVTTMTYWRARRGQLKAWPTRAAYGPVLLKRDAPAAPGTDEYRRWLDEFVGIRNGWGDAVCLDLEADPDAARRRFAELTTRCYVCARRLTDAKSKVLGIGPDCRAPFDEAAVTAALTPAIARAHAAALTSEETPDAV